MTEAVQSNRIAKGAVGVAVGVALTGGLLAGTAPQADAASNVWDRVAKCESSGNWKINTGNGYYGGLQFSSSTWKAYGGRSYARQANGATKAEQIKVAQRVLKSQGPGAWPVCSKRAGLTKSNGGAASATKSTATKAKASSAKKSTAKHATTSKPSHSTGTITVRSGDTLAKIAHRYDVKGGWKGLWKLNKSTVKNPNHIKVGQKLRVR